MRLFATIAGALVLLSTPLSAQWRTVMRNDIAEPISYEFFAQQEDTSTVFGALYWQPVNDRRGNPISYYTPGWIRCLATETPENCADSSRVVIDDSVTTTSDTLSFDLADFIQLGDTLWVLGRVRAIDARGVGGRWTYTEPQAIAWIDTIGPAPPVEDSILVAGTQGDVISIDADSIDVDFFWQEATDRRGDPVEDYAVSLFINNISVLDTVVTGNNLSVQAANAAREDTLELFFEIQSIDIRGVVGQIATSSVISVTRPAEPTIALLSQVSFRFRPPATDAGAWDESIPENSNVNWGLQDPFLLRLVIDEVNGVSLDSIMFSFEYSLDGVAWDSVPGEEVLGIIRAIDSDSVGDSDSTTRQLSGGSGEFVAGCRDNFDGVCGPINFPADGLTEIEFHLILDSLSNGDSIQLRAVANGNPIDYAIIPTITISDELGPIGTPNNFVLTLVAETVDSATIEFTYDGGITEGATDGRDYYEWEGYRFDSLVVAGRDSINHQARLDTLFLEHAPTGDTLWVWVRSRFIRDATAGPWGYSDTLGFVNDTLGPEPPVIDSLRIWPAYILLETEPDSVVTLTYSTPVYPSYPAKIDCCWDVGYVDTLPNGEPNPCRILYDGQSLYECSPEWEDYIAESLGYCRIDSSELQGQCPPGPDEIGLLPGGCSYCDSLGIWNGVMIPTTEFPPTSTSNVNYWWGFDPLGFFTHGFSNYGTMVWMRKYLWPIS